MKLAVSLVPLATCLVVPAVSYAQNAPYECDDQFGECGTPEQSGGGCGCGGSILIADTDLGDTYQYADDYDDDGSEDPYDNCPFIRNPDQADGDGDEFGDACDNCPADNNSDQADLDGDNQGDVCDDDDDGDGVADQQDTCPLVANPVLNGVQVDTDGDGQGDACDDDDDDDGFADLEDNCPLISNPNQEEISDASCYADTDGDGIFDHRDNCLAVHNPEQTDTDSDGLGDACDADLDGDGKVNDLDNCPMVPQEEFKDEDRDGLGDECDPTYCYVVLEDADNCLDPQGAFKVYGAYAMVREGVVESSGPATTGERVLLRLFANRQNAPLDYRWTIVEAPTGSGATVSHPYGSVRLSTPYEYHYPEDNEPVLVPDLPGTYVVSLRATQAWEDKVSGEVGQTSEVLTTIEVTGDPVAAGCAVSPLPFARTGGLSLLLFGLFFVVRRFRRE